MRWNNIKNIYDKKIDEAWWKLQSDVPEVQEMKIRTDIKDWSEKRRDIELLAVEGKVTGSTLAVPAYNQLDIPDGNGTMLCWAACASMWISHLLEDAVFRAEEIAISVTGSSIPGIYNAPRRWASLDAIPQLSETLGITKHQKEIRNTLSITQIREILNDGSPFVALYGAYNQNSAWKGHYVIVIGYASAPGHDSLIISNDPMGGVMRVQTMEEFCGNYIGDDPGFKPWVHTVINK